ncbi:hypothetical protein FRB94_001010 [Tulasnella sp. JGI-2019a]|nr:hypothetical protein FRB93_008111 [Tulasnella sp. JGI-2019a]KAG8988191.1 hypothetical protein FRB94_001010 [Tulasnella sp. JGI-2019a]KAG9030715.1 hypothetical protein FRB95_003617 [Tulasnella sp. JGI-2019a]
MRAITSPNPRRSPFQTPSPRDTTLRSLLRETNVFRETSEEDDEDEALEADQDPEGTNEI